MELKETSDPHNRPSSRSRSSIFFLEGSRSSTSLLVNASSFLSLFIYPYLGKSFFSFGGEKEGGFVGTALGRTIRIHSSRKEEGR